MITETLQDIEIQDKGLYKAYLRGRNGGREAHYLMHRLRQVSTHFLVVPVLVQKSISLIFYIPKCVYAT
jgi:hypothetical protein